MARKLFFTCSLVLFAVSCFGQHEALLEGFVREVNTSSPVEGATVILLPSAEHTQTDERGKFYFRDASQAMYVQVSSIGHGTITSSITNFRKQGNSIFLSHQPIRLSEVRISAAAGDQYRPIGKLDIRMRGINNSQEVLQMVPGLFIGQHAGGGKAEQIFLRGFDSDHGTDIQISVDGIPVNMVSHAHGQGYADLHFLIPELIEGVTFKKGPYYAEKGNFATSGYVDFSTPDGLQNNVVKVEGGMYGTFRTVGMLQLLNKKAEERGQSAFIASEYMAADGYFEHPQDFKRVNIFGKYTGTLSKRNQLSLSLSSFSSSWNASGQIPDRAVESGLTGFYGSIDPDEGGQTSRTNVSTLLTTTMNKRAYLKNQLYYSRYGFRLYSNFTFFLEEPVHGDQIRQSEKRDLFGYNSSYHILHHAGRLRFNTVLGANIRLDRTEGSELSRTLARKKVLSALKLGDIAEDNISGYVSETVAFSHRLSIYTGLRYDYFKARYTDRLSGNSTGKAAAGIVSPKLGINYQFRPHLQLYLSGGKGFHSNDTRVVVPQHGLRILPAAYGTDLGTVLKPAKNLLINAALWYLWLDQEFVYVGDAGVVEPGGESRRYGAGISVRYQPMDWLYADIDVNYSYGRAAGAPVGANFLPLAPGFTSVGGVAVKLKSGVNASIRYRLMGDRPANEDYSTQAKGYFITDAFIGYLQKKYELSLSMHNLFNRKWKETQFDTESRLSNEALPVSEIHFTPGTPFFLKAGFSYLF